MDLSEEVELHNRFRHHTPKSDRVAENHEFVRSTLELATIAVLGVLPERCRERSVFITKMEEAMMWANAGIARNQPSN